MNNPFDLFQNKEAQTEQESHRLKVRVTGLLCLFGALLLTYLGILFSLQIVHGEEYLSNSSYTIVKTETLDTDRGDIVDRNGKLLVGNRLSYNVTLDHTAMGSDRNQTLLALLALCRNEGVAWTDTFPISETAPWTYTKEDVFCYEGTDVDGNTKVYSTMLGTLADRRGWVDDPAKDSPTPEELMLAMCKTYDIKVEHDAITPETRALLGVLYEIYLRAYEITYNEYIFARDVDITFITKVKERSFPGVEIEKTTTRYYNTDSAAHVLGRIGLIDPDEWPTYKELGYPMNAYVGKEGVELSFEQYLHGSSGTRRIETDPEGNILSESWSVEPAPGSNVVLTIDETLQSTTEELLAQYVATLENPAGAAAVMVDMTGGVLALASYPDYDLSAYLQNYNDLLADPDKPLYNRATQGLYPPGSTFKPLTAIAALSEGVISTTSKVVCTGKYEYYADYQPVCWIYSRNGRNHDTENVTEAITDSCNIFFYDVGRRLGITALVDYAKQFGLGRYTGIEIAEKQGRIAGPETSTLLGEDWFGGMTLSAAIGQGNNQFTPLQMANYIATLVNGGNNYEAHLLKEVKSSDYSETLYTYEPVLRNSIEISDSALKAVKQGMLDLSKTNSMKPYFSSLPVEVGCKTGTAEVTGAADSNAVFVCFAPYDNPQVALCIVAEQGSKGSSLASVAAGMLAQYFATSGAQNNVEPENTLIP